ncbi:G-type lectin S-receptor-like serine/threonine-protein kinase At4g27290 [Punica granatum]|uniref:G-type lectin S-receptor-like serine/threonine-protein kinase At4g27290 n=1 Tax=Punica granatum TaxID=22663 RepID=A0A6P8DEG9_PUNGR|nr:G-type lectin S-receptor-like serine/threonine-protein kinase At4g27290 [Punica granatum]
MVLKYDNSESYLWQSFNHPADTMLAGMKIGWDFKLGIERQLTSWKSAEDPSLGQFSYRMDPRGPQPKMLEGNITRYRGFPHFSAFSSIRTYFESIISLIIVYNTQETYGTYYLRDQGTLSRLLVNYTGKVQQYMWNNQTLDWMLLYELPSDACDEYSKCGPNAVCVVANTVRTCKCLPGYVSKLARDSNTPNLLYSGGYVRKSPFNCSVSEGFKLVRPVKLPELSQFEMNSCMSINECEKMCLMNCTCTAYSRTGDSSDRTGCQFWFGDLLDIRELIKGDFYRNELFIRL